MVNIGFGLYLLFVVSWFVRVAERAPALASVRIDLLLMAVLSVLALVTTVTSQRRQPTTRFHVHIPLIALYALLVLPFVEWPGSVLNRGLAGFAKGAFFFAITVTFVDSDRKLRTLLLVFGLTQLVRVIEPLYLHLTEGYWGSVASMGGSETLQRLSGAPVDTVNPNGLAFVAVTLLSFGYPFWSRWPFRLSPFVAVAAASVYVVVLTGSRTGMVGLASVAMLIWFFSRHKVVVGLGLSVAVLAALPYLSETAWDRYVSLWDREARNAATAETRWKGLQDNFAVGLRRPLFGHGLGTSRELNANFTERDQPAHSLYLEVFQELGIVGLAAYLWLLLSLLRAVWELASRRKHFDAFGAAATEAICLWTCLNFVFSLASYGLSSYEWYFLCGLVIVVQRSRSSEGAESRSTPAQWAYGAPAQLVLADARGSGR